MERGRIGIGAIVLGGHLAGGGHLRFGFDFDGVSSIMRYGRHILCIP